MLLRSLLRRQPQNQAFPTFARLNATLRLHHSFPSFHALHHHALKHSINGGRVLLPRRQFSTIIQQSKWHQRVKYWLTKTTLPWSSEELLTLASWLLFSQTMFVVLGTTTFVSLVLTIANSLSFQEWIAHSLSNYLTQEMGLKVEFASAIVPRWKNGMIRLHQVSILKAPTLEDSPDTYFDLKIDKCDLTISLKRWLDGQGLIEDCELYGVRGNVDLSRLDWDPDTPWEAEKYRAWLKSSLPDLVINSVRVEDAMISFDLPPQYRSYNISVFRGEATRLRSHWFLYDLLSRGSMVGLFDGCLFSIHRAPKDEAEKILPLLTTTTALSEDEGISYQRVSHLKMDGVDIAHLNAGIRGPFGWITNGTVDFNAYLCFPETERSRTNPAEVIKHVAKDIREKIDDLDFGIWFDSDSTVQPTPRLEKVVLMDLEVRFNHINATIPLSAPGMSWSEQAVARLVAGYLNSARVDLPIHCKFQLALENFDGALSLYHADLPGLASEHVGLAMAKAVNDERARNRRMKRVGLWALQSVTRNILTLIDTLRSSFHLRVHQA